MCWCTFSSNLVFSGDRQGELMKYYEYISDSKVDMLLPQVPLAAKQKISKELGVDFKIFSGKLKIETSTLEDRVARLRAVSSFIAADQKVGTINSPGAWIADTATVGAGYFADDTKLVGFAGKSDGTYFLLAGSSAHTIGADPKDASIGKGFSFMPRMAGYLKDALKQVEDYGVDENDDYVKMYLGADGSDTKQGYWMKIIEKSWHDLSGVTMRIEFIAKRLLTIKGNRGAYLLATPLYVASVD
jgi:hypothetical protein